MKRSTIIYTFLFFALINYDCDKKFLDAKPNDRLEIPHTLVDFQALLDNLRLTGSGGMAGGMPQLLLVGNDEYYVPDEIFAPFTTMSKNLYLWDQKDPYGGATSLNDWGFPYRVVYYANVALEGIEKIKKDGANDAEWNNIKGGALFLRAHTFYTLAQVFAPPYNSASATASPGIPLRLKADISDKVQRATLEQTYQQIIKDLTEARSLLPALPLVKIRASRAGVFALLARTYQTMQDYEQALVYADSCLALQSDLIDYNSVSATPTYPFLTMNDEVIFATTIIFNPNQLYYPTRARVDSDLYASYSNTDLRKTLFFREREPGKFSFRGSYDNSGYPFMGLTTGEIYLIRAECHARANNVQAAMNDLNRILKKRYIIGSFVETTANDAKDALMKVLTERRKELVFRGLRWTDLRRLNQTSETAITIKRLVNGQPYELPPNDLRYTWPIPADAMGFNSDWKQNPR